ncbi:MAG: hypothetical protein J6B04_06535 [Clostridia bacterium]|nr:hypothetical protein [Clostridia bacterium]
MAKRVIKVIIALAVALCSCGIFVAADCDLSHKHYLNDYGVCRSCQEDKAVLLTLNENGEYKSDEVTIDVYNDTIIKFVSNGEKGIELKINCESEGVKTVTLLSDTTAYIPINKNYQTGNYVSEIQFVKGETYYVKISFSSVKTASFIISGLN